MPFGRRAISGNVTLTKTGIKANDAIEGEFEFSISEMRGGFIDRRPGGPGGPGGGPPPGGPFGMEGAGGIPWSPVALVSLPDVKDDLSVTDAQRLHLPVRHPSCTDHDLQPLIHGSISVSGFGRRALTCD